MSALLALLLSGLAHSAPCPPPENFPELGRNELERRFQASSEPCERFSLAYALHFSGRRFEPSWGLRALGILRSEGDFRSLTTYASQLHGLLAPGDAARAAFHYLALAGVHGALESIDAEHDQTWLNWALAIGVEPGPAQTLAFDSYLDLYPDDPRRAEVDGWKESAVDAFLELERGITRRQFRRKQYFAPVVRWESAMRLPSLQSSKRFPEVIEEVLLAREALLDKLDRVEERQLRIWLRIDPPQELSREKIRAAVRAENCSDLGKARRLWPARFVRFRRFSCPARG